MSEHQEPTAEEVFRDHAYKDVPKEDIKDLPIVSYNGPVRLIVTASAAEKALEELSHEKVLGFDTETRAAFRKGEVYPPALVQLAGEHVVYLFRLNRLRKLGGLETILADPKIVKTGVALLRDIRELVEIVEFEPGGFVDLEEFTNSYGIAANGLRGIAAAVLRGRVSKGAQRSNWAQSRLTDSQIEYAATDAWVCREVYVRLSALNRE